MSALSQEEIESLNKMLLEKRCFFCGCILNENLQEEHSGDILSYTCPYCGRYKIVKEAIINLKSVYKFRALATSIAQERKLAGQDGYFLQWSDIRKNDDEHKICIGEVPFLNNYPNDYLEKLDRILINIGRKTNNSPLVVYQPSAWDFGLFFVEPSKNFYQNYNRESINALIGQIQETIKILEKLGWIRIVKNSIIPNHITLTVNGLKYLHELHNLSEEKSQAFVAMWFTNKNEYGEKLKKYVDSLRYAINSTGYNLYIANQEKYNGAIMNRVINQIKESRFLIADLTCDREKGMRGGVYYEAGLAAGLGMPVILTCNKETHLQDLVHFDLKQFNTILWYIDENGIIRADGHPDEDFSDYLAEWIIATVGKKK